MRRSCSAARNLGIILNDLLKPGFHIIFKGLTANAADRDTDGDVEAEAKGEAEAEDQQVLIATLDLQGGMLSIFLKHIFKCISNDSR